MLLDECIIISANPGEQPDTRSISYRLNVTSVVTNSTQIMGAYMFPSTCVQANSMPRESSLLVYKADL